MNAQKLDPPVLCLPLAPCDPPQNEYYCRLDFLWKKKLRQEQEETETMENLTRLLLENVLPAHVAPQFIGQNRRNEVTPHPQLLRPKGRKSWLGSSRLDSCLTGWGASQAHMPVRGLHFYKFLGSVFGEHSLCLPRSYWEGLSSLIAAPYPSKASMIVSEQCEGHSPPISLALHCPV